MGGDRGIPKVYRVTAGARALTVEIVEAEGRLIVRIDGGEEHSAAVRQLDEHGLYAFLVDQQSFSALVSEREGSYAVVVDGETVDLVVEDERAARLASVAAAGRAGVGEATVKAPMPGLVVAVNVQPGQQVTKGASLIVLQAMKMENDLTAREDATVKEVLVTPGQTVDQGQSLVILE